ncbi:dynein light chain roadblock-type [Plakobranchus ocellatus]|uniref:Dynein light chain roadblock-type n=1 Tax=Plakobranchus ocellatus TaxID=259542 RepID=A0AAV4DK46_9GAST|nr:dynein light chain roadblock-type [Plakobranchus ocellatus]
MDCSEVMKRITSHRGVKQLVIINKDGLPLKSIPEMEDLGESQARSLHELAGAARRMVRDVDPTDDLMFLRVCSKTDELLISPGKFA